MTASRPETILMRLTESRYLASGIHRLRFEPVVSVPLEGIEPGAHVGLLLPNGIERQYSLLSCADPTAYVVGVKREENGRGGSRYIHDELRVGAEIQVAQPRNNFPLDESASQSIFFAGGIGITPIHAMIERLDALGKPWTLHYATRTRGEMALREAFEGRPNAHLHIDDEAGHLLPLQERIAAAAPDAHLYCCGPEPMLAAFEKAAASRDTATVHLEYFTAKFEQALEGGFTVELARSGGVHRVPPGQSILQVLVEAGIDVMSSCEEGICGACETKVLAGVPDHRDSILTERERAANKSMMICCSGCLSDKLVLDL